MATSSTRALPNYLVIGTQRGGTTALHTYLSRHPQVIPPSRKEVQFFDRFYYLGRPWYRAHFPRIREVEALGERAVTGEATANYLFDYQAPSRAYSVLPDAKMVVLLRNPVDRAHSAWKLLTRQGRESRSMAVALKDEMITEHQRESSNWFLRPDPAYLARGRYLEQLRRWWTVFDTSALLIVRSEDLFQSPSDVLGIVTDFLGIRAWRTDAFRGAHSTTSTPMDRAMRSDLIDYFESHNRALEGAIGRQLHWD